MCIACDSFVVIKGSQELASNPFNLWRAIVKASCIVDLSMHGSRADHGTIQIITPCILASIAAHLAAMLNECGGEQAIVC